MRISLLNLCYLVGIFTHVFEAEAFVASFPGFKPVLEGVRSRFTRIESSTRRSISLVPSHLTGPDDSAASNGELLLYDDLVQLRSEIRARENSTLYQKYASVIPMTVKILRQKYGERTNWWGDLTASETRVLYWQLLPSVVQVEKEFEGLPLRDRAYIASMARYAAKVYARERSMVPNRAAAMVFDGTRYALNTGKWSWTGMSVEEIWLKYEREVKEELMSAAGAAAMANGTTENMNMAAGATAGGGGGPAVAGSAAAGPGGVAPKSNPSGGGAPPSAVAIDEEELYRRLYQRIILKSCSTNRLIDRIAAPRGSSSNNNKPRNKAAVSAASATVNAATSATAAGSPPPAVGLGAGLGAGGGGLSEAEYRRRLGEVLATARFKAAVVRWVGALDAALFEVLKSTKRAKQKTKEQRGSPLLNHEDERKDRGG